jgi:hypothetical protein
VWVVVSPVYAAYARAMEVLPDRPALDVLEVPSSL